MMRPVAATVTSIVVVLACTHAASAQALADVAKREAARRGTVSSPGKVYTNGDLVSDFTKPSTPPPSPAPAAKAEAAPQKAAEEPLQTPVAAEGTEVERQAPSDKGEDYWRQKSATIRAAIEAQRAQIAALEGRVQSLAVGKTAADQREGGLSADLLARAKADLVSLEEEKARFEGLAKAKNVPASWLR